MSTIRDIFQQITRMRLTDLVDILAVAFLIFMIMHLFRSTGTHRVAKVVLLIIAVVVIAGLTDFLKLYTLSFLLNQFLSFGLIAVVILFQPELRRMIDHMSNVKINKVFGTTKPEQAMEPVISHVVRACTAMSQEKVGALICFARDNPLDEYFKSGTMIDAQVSDQLLRNIFFPKAALHDGAMIIRDGRVTAAACVLPLSESDRLSADLGTRHRAGLGLSEVTDALVVIVSEETGAISVAVGGMLKRHLAPQTLEKLLRNELCPAEPDGKEEKLVVKLRQKLHKKEKEGSGINEK